MSDSTTASPSPAALPANQPSHADAERPLHAVLDTSTRHATLTVGVPGAAPLLNLANLPLGQRSAHVVPILVATFADAGIAFGDIGHWTVGMGPGSFAGVRMGAAFVLGAVAVSGARVRGLPSSLALVLGLEARSPLAVGTRVATLHDGRKGQTIVTTWQRDAAGWREVADATCMRITELAGGVQVDHAVMLADDPARDEVAAVAESLSFTVTTLSAIDGSLLLSPPGHDWPTNRVDDSALAPVYVRPAVFVEPRPVYVAH